MFIPKIERNTFIFRYFSVCCKLVKFRQCILNILKIIIDIHLIGINISNPRK